MMEITEQSHKKVVHTIILSYFGEIPSFIRRMTIGICNEVYDVGLNEKEVIVRLSPDKKYLMGSHDHIPQLKSLGIKVPDILEEDYTQTQVPLCFQIQNKIEGKDLGQVIENLSDAQLKALAKEIANIFKKVQTLPTTNQFGVVWGGGDNELSDSWTQRMKIWIEESKERGKKTGVMDNALAQFADNLYIDNKTYFDSVKPLMYYGDICSKNVMIKDGAFNGLVDLDGLTQGDPLEAIGRIKLSWFGTRHGEVYTLAVMDELGLDDDQRAKVTLYALINAISWTCENGIQFNQNTKTIVDKEKERKDKIIIKALIDEYTQSR